MIDKQLEKLLAKGIRFGADFKERLPDDYADEAKAQALTAIYEIGLGVIGEDEDVTKTSAITILEKGEPTEVINFPIVRNGLRASQREKLKEVCGCN